MKKDKNLFWIDLEMTGLDPKKDVILEIASIVTDSDLNIIARGPELVIHQDEKHLKVMNELVTRMHTVSGLVQRVKESTVTLEQAEKQTFDFLKTYCDQNTALIAGNSVWKDRSFLAVYMPRIINYCHYRLLDVTAIKEVVSRWHKNHPHAVFQKKETHRALQDIQESIAELQHFRKYFLT